jgi:DNA-binding transcriptional LysR family regulator
MAPIDGIEANMRAVDVSQVDLNLLVVLGALLEHGSVTGAAKQLGLTQSTVSHGLARLRDVLGDPLLVRVGRGMTPTPRAQALAPAVARLLRDIRMVLSGDVGFTAATSKRVFSVASPDLVAAAFPELLGRLGREAPHVRLEMTPPPADLGAALADGSIDLGVLPARTEGAGLVQRVIGTVSWCVLARKGHPAVKKNKIDLPTWLSTPSVLVRTRDGRGELLRELATRGHHRPIAFIAPSFLAAVQAVAHTDWFFAAPRELVGGLAAELSLLMIEPPAAVPKLRIAVVWHERMHADAGHQWLRELVTEVVQRRISKHRAPRGHMPQTS